MERFFLDCGSGEMGAVWGEGLLWGLWGICFPAAGELLLDSCFVLRDFSEGTQGSLKPVPQHINVRFKVLLAGVATWTEITLQGCTALFSIPFPPLRITPMELRTTQLLSPTAEQFDQWLAEEIRRLSVDVLKSGVFTCTACGERAGYYVIQYGAQKHRLDAGHTYSFLRALLA